MHSNREVYHSLAFLPPVWTNWGMLNEPHDITSLDTVDLSTLRSWYGKIEKNPAPPSASVEFLREHLAWHFQAIQQGLQPVPLRQRLLKKSRKQSLQTRNLPQAGTRLIREWQGKTYEVTALSEGYLWQGKSYRSLSQVATDITGTRWSGPRFFGVKRPGNLA
jgi:hypothetical protein